MRPYYITQEEAVKSDKKLLEIIPLTCLIETAGFAAFEVILKIIKDMEVDKKINKILVCIGPGNNGGDGLVVARYLKYSGFDVDVWCGRTKHRNLLQICQLMGVTFIQEGNDKDSECEKEDIPEINIDHNNNNTDAGLGTIDLGRYDLIIDALFGFSFKKPLREPYLSIVRGFKNCTVISIDVPSGYDVDEVNVDGAFAILSLCCNH
ncbi:NAD(P)H-hydrate epimerase, partial [Dictyocoela roeselum]